MSAREKKKEKKKKLRKDRSEIVEGGKESAGARAVGLLSTEADNCGSSDVASDTVTESSGVAEIEIKTETVVTTSGKRCNTCGGYFELDAEYRLHFR